jgi:Cytotoxic
LAIPVPKPSLLDNCDFLGAFNGKRRWRSSDGQRLYTWDALHGEIEVFNRRGRHLGAIEPRHGRLVKDPVKGRKIDV